MPVKLYYHRSSPPSRAVWMLLEELKGDKFDYEAQELDMMKGEQKSVDFLKVNPVGELPAISDGNFNLWESRAILSYLASTYGPKVGKASLFPDDPKTRAVITKVMFTDTDNYGKICGYLNIGGVMKGEPLCAAKEPDFKKALKSYNDLIGDDKSYMVGNTLTIADFSCLASLGILSLIDFKGWDDYPNIKRWFSVLKEKPSVIKCFIEAEQVFKAPFQAKLAEATKE